MGLPWYGAPVIFLVAIICLNIILVMLYRLLRDPDSCCVNDPGGPDDEIETAVLAEKEERQLGVTVNTEKGLSPTERETTSKKHDDMDSSVKYAESYSSSLSKKYSEKVAVKPLVTVVVDSAAESSLSGDEEDRTEGSITGVLTPLSAYGDSIASDSELGFLASSGNPEFMQIHLSLIFSNERRYVAGKVSQIKGLKYNTNSDVDQLKVHVVYLPLKKYILKTKYYKVNTSKDNCRVDEYFKMKFRKKPDISSSVLRLRVYGRKVRTFSSKERCLGETMVNFSEFAPIKGGITLRRNVLPPSPV